MNFPKFMIRQTGGFAVGAISTKSRAASFAFWSASAIATTPRGSPSAPIRRTSFHRIWSLIRIVFLSIFHLRRELTTLLRNRVGGSFEKRVDRHGSGVSSVPQPDRDRTGPRLLLADDQHGRHLLDLRLADAGAELLVALVRFDSQSRPEKSLGGGAGGGREAIGHRENDPLDRSDPEREVPGGVLDKDAEEPLDRPEDRPVEHDRAVGLSVLSDVRQIESLRLRRVVLDRAQLPGPPDRVLHAKVDFRSVEVPVARREGIRTSDFLQGRLQGGFGPVPVLVGTHPLRRR